MTTTTFTRTGRRAQQMRVVPAEILKRLYARSDRAGLVQTAAHLALLIAGGWLVWHARGLGWPDNLLLIPAVLVQAVFVNALFGAMHESVHYGSFRTRWAADLLAFLSGAAILQILVHLRFFLHVNFTTTPRENIVALAFTAVLVVIMVGGSLWIMIDLHQRMAL